MLEKPFDLKCEYLTDPMGIDTTKPRFSWKLIDSTYTRGQKQTAYQVLVASNMFNLDNAMGDIWNSGKVQSSESNLVDYQGIVLIASMNCFWKVKVWDKDNNESDWSSNARFSIGLLENSDWKGSWITCTGVNNINPWLDHVWYRKKFFLGNQHQSACAYIASIGYHELYVNGIKADSRVLSPSQSRIEDGKRVFYITYDISNMLNEGYNVIALWTAAGWTRYKSAQTPGFVCQINICSFNGMQEIHSDSSWKLKKSSSSYMGGWEWGDFGGEVIDSKNYISGWNEVSCDDSAWDDATTFSCNMIRSSEMLQPDRIIETIDPISISGNNPYVVDMGKNYTGWFSIELKNGRSENRVTFKIADKSTEAMTFNQQYQYIYDSSGEGIFCNRFNYFGGRYITIEGLDSEPSLSNIKGFVISNDMKRISSFSCSNTLFNHIYETDLHTFLANTLNGVTVDCPHRERLGYGETGNSTTWGCGLTSFDSAAFYTRSLQNWRDVQQEDGHIPHVAPNHDGGGGTAWSSYPVFGAWEVYVTYGDKQILTDNYQTIKKWLNYLDLNLSNGILQRYEKDEWGFLGDWATPHGDEWGNTQEALLFNNCVYAYILDIGVKIAEILGEVNDSNIFSLRLSKLTTNIHNYFYNESKKEYIDSRQIHLAMPLYTGITPDNLKDGVFKNLVNEILNNNTYFDTGSSGLVFLLKYLIEDVERNDLIYECLNKNTYPSYGYFLSQGQTTWPEMWDMKDIYGGSRIHTCYTGIAGWFIKGLGGIRSDPSVCGFKDFLIKPSIVGDIEWVNTEYESLYGIIKSNWTKSFENNTVEFHFEIPVNTMAIAYIPTENTNDIKEGNLSASESEGVQFIKTEKGHSVFIVQSGKYHFTMIITELLIS